MLRIFGGVKQKLKINTRMKTYFDFLADSVMETYSSNNSSFLTYMRSGADPYPIWGEICEWLEENGHLDVVNNILGAGNEVEDGESLRDTVDASFFFKLPESIQTAAFESTTEYLMHHDPAMVPTGGHMAINDNRLLPRKTWLIHFSDDAHSVAVEGFTRGMDQVDRLGLTSFFGDAEKPGGYNFAFVAEPNSRYVHAGSKYGRDAVMFMNSGVECYHYGDEETQVVFWGADVHPRDIAFIRNAGDGVYEAVDKRNSDRVIRRGDLGAIVKWMMDHFAQYRRSMGCA